MHILFLTDNFPPEVNAPASRTLEHYRLDTGFRRYDVLPNFRKNSKSHLFYMQNANFKDLTPDHLLDEVIEKNRKRQEELRLRVIEKIVTAIDQLSREIAFHEAYLFGSVTKPFRFSERSDIDIGFVGLDNRHYFKVMSYISEEVGHDVDIVQLEDHRLADKIKKGGILWRRKD